MLRFIVRRVLSSLITLFLFVTVLFFVAQLIMPGDYVSQILGLSPAERAKLRQELGLDLPLGEQYLHWLDRLAHGDLGTSFLGQPVADLLGQALPPTLLMFITGTLIAFGLGQWLGKVTGWRRSRAVSGAATIGAVAFYTAFPAWLAFLVAYLFGREISVVGGPFGQGASYGKLWEDALFTPQQIMLYMLLTLAGVGLVVILINRWLWRRRRRHLPTLLMLAGLLAGPVASWYAFGFNVYALDLAQRGLPTLITYVLLSFGETMLIIQTNMQDTLYEDYIVTARAKGLPERAVRDRHAVRNALIPVVSRLLISLPYLLTGMVIIEHALGWPGLGGALYRSLNVQDMPTVMGLLLFVGVFSLIVRLVLDILHMTLDPRLRPTSGAGGRREWTA